MFGLRHGRKEFDGPKTGLVDEARGRTWLTAPRTVPPPKDATVVSAIPTPEGTRYRIVTDTPPEVAEPIEPSFEDGYMALATKDVQ